MASKKKTATTAKAWRVATILLDENENRLTIVGQQLKDGRIRSAVLHRVGKKTVRGMAMIHVSAAEAQTRVEALAADAIKRGWSKRERKVRATFTELPAPSGKARRAA